MNFSKHNRAAPTLAHATGSADRTGTTIDTQGFYGVAWAVHFGAIDTGAVTSVKIQGGHLADMSDAVDLGGTEIAVADSDDYKVFVLDVAHAMHRYLRIVVDKDATNDTTEAAIAYLYSSDKVPVSQSSDVSVEFHHAPAAGVA